MDLFPNTQRRKRSHGYRSYNNKKPTQIYTQCLILIHFYLASNKQSLSLDSFHTELYYVPLRVWDRLFEEA